MTRVRSGTSTSSSRAIPSSACDAAKGPRSLACSSEGLAHDVEFGKKRFVELVRAAATTSLDLLTRVEAFAFTAAVATGAFRERTYAVRFFQAIDALACQRAMLLTSLTDAAPGLHAYLGPPPVLPYSLAGQSAAPVSSRETSEVPVASTSAPASYDLEALRAAALQSKKRKRALSEGELEEGEIDAADVPPPLPAARSKPASPAPSALVSLPATPAPPAVDAAASSAADHLAIICALRPPQRPR